VSFADSRGGNLTAEVGGVQIISDFAPGDPVLQGDKLIQSVRDYQEARIHSAKSP